MNAKGPATEEGGPRGLENDASTDVIVGALKALAHPIRYRIVQLLADKGSFGVEDENCCSRDEACVCKISELFDVSAPTLSHHLKVLREAGLVEGRRDGVWIYYKLRWKTLAGLRASLALIAPRDSA